MINKTFKIFYGTIIFLSFKLSEQKPYSTLEFFFIHHLISLKDYIKNMIAEMKLTLYTNFTFGGGGVTWVRLVFQFQ